MEFFYSRTEKNQDGSDKLLTDSFNTDRVIRTLEMEDGRRLVLLDDIHQRSENVPDIDPRTNKVKGMKRQTNVYQSEIFLNKEDNLRFVKKYSEE